MQQKSFSHSPQSSLLLPLTGEVGRGLLSPHFSLSEFTRSATAQRYCIDNRPPEHVVENLRQLCRNVLEPLRQYLHCPITVTSGYRAPLVNHLIGGVRNSQHQQGEAADIQVPRSLMPLAYMYIRDHLLYDQLIMERTWIHVSYRQGRCRHQEVVIGSNGNEN